MPYETFSSQSPSNYTGSLSAALIENVQNNPNNSGASSIYFPTYYDQFVNKISVSAGRASSISDEVRELGEFIATPSGSYAGYVYLYHRPVPGASFSVSDGVLATGVIDNQNGILYFSTAPTAQSFTISYMAIADAYYGDHINAVQNAVMAIERVLGAGSVSGEGLRNAEYWVDSYPASLSSILPRAINVRGLTKNTAIKGTSGTGVSITVGNGGDTVTVDARTVTFTNSHASYNMTGYFGDSVYDPFYFRGPVAITAASGNLLGSTYGGAQFAVGDPTRSKNTSFPYSATGYTMPSTGTIARVYGDLQVVGNIYLSGSFQVLNSATGTQINVIGETVAIGQDLRVTGNSTLGSSTNTYTNVNGNLTVGRYIHILGSNADVSRFDTPVDVRNQGNSSVGYGGIHSDSAVPVGTEHYPDLPFHVSSLRQSPGSFTDRSVNKNTTFDGLDPSYIAKLLRFRGLDRNDWKGDCINAGPVDGIAGSVTSVSAPGVSQWVDTGICWSQTATGFTAGVGYTGAINTQGYKPFRWFHLGGTYYHGKFNNEQVSINTGEFSGAYVYGDGYEWRVRWTQNDTTLPLYPGAFKLGADVPLYRITPSYQTNPPYCATGAQVELSRSFNTTVTVGDTYKIYHPNHSRPNFIDFPGTPGDLEININVSEADPLICNIKGITKIYKSPCTLAVATGRSFVYIDLNTPETAKQQLDGSILEADATCVVNQEYRETDTRILAGEIYVESTGVSQVVNYAYNGKYDTLWMRTQTTGNVWQNNGNSAFSYRANSVPTNISATGTIEAPSSYTNGQYMDDILISNSGEFKLRIHHNIGSMRRLKDANIKVFVSPNLGNDYPVHGGTLREGPDYAYISELPQVKVKSAVPYPCWEIVHETRNYTDFQFYNINEIPGAIIGAKSITNSRNIALTGGLGSTTLGTSTTPADRTRYWWWTRIVFE